MNPLVKAAAERIDAATAGRALSGLSGVVAGDVVAVAAVADPGGKDGVIGALFLGAARAGPPTTEIHQRTDHLRYMLDLLAKSNAKVHANPEGSGPRDAPDADQSDAPTV
jgi:hypothetical protein